MCSMQLFNITHSLINLQEHRGYFSKKCGLHFPESVVIIICALSIAVTCDMTPTQTRKEARVRVDDPKNLKCQVYDRDVAKCWGITLSSCISSL